jgi:hypothetical protein
MAMNPRRVCRLSLLAGWMVAASAAAAMEDPTRPPAGFYALGASGAGGTGDEGPVLQSVLISEAGRLAIISGELVQLGGRVAGGRLVKVSETEVVLLQGAARKTLRLYPGVEKREPGFAATQRAKR